MGKNLPTSLREAVQVRLSDSDGHDAVLVGDRDYAARSSQALAAEPTLPE